jgi:kynurenine formamidase
VHSSDDRRESEKKAASRSERIPSYRELLARSDGRPPGTAWGIFGDDDELGTVNLLTPARILGGVSEARAGQVLPLNWRLDLPDPAPISLLQRSAPVRVQVGAAKHFERDDYVDRFYLQSSTQWDGLRHIRRPEGFYNGVTAEVVDDPGSTALGIDRWARRGIVGRGVLLDVDRFYRSTGRPTDPAAGTRISAQDLDATAAAQGTTIAPGDILLVRTGWITWYEGRARAERVAWAEKPMSMGLAADLEMRSWLWDHQLVAVAADNMAVEALPPPEDTSLVLHFWLIPALGMVMGEFFWLDELASVCASGNRWTFLFMSAPMNLPGAVGSPANAIALW